MTLLIFGLLGLAAGIMPGLCRYMSYRSLEPNARNYLRLHWRYWRIVSAVSFAIALLFKQNELWIFALVIFLSGSALGPVLAKLIEVSTRQKYEYYNKPRDIDGAGAPKAA